MTEPPEQMRIAKHLSRAGIASRREAERMIEAGRVKVNGTVLSTPAALVTGQECIEVDGKLVAALEPPRLWRFHKPKGVVTTASDEKGRRTIYDTLPDDLPRLMPVGRLDITSEGLLLLTNDGGLKRKMELPSTGWSRRYRVRVHGSPNDETFAPLREGAEIEGVRYRPIQVSLDRQQGANAWLTVGLQEGKNREIRRVMEHLGLSVNRLIRLSYGPFQLLDIPVGGVQEVKRRVLEDQLGLNKRGRTGEAGSPPRRRLRSARQKGK